jgi:ketosteroid isomerase-like protein
MLETKDRTETRDTITTYFERLFGGGWEALVADDIVFTSPSAATHGKTAYVDGTNRFKRVARSVHVRQLIVEGDNAVAVTQYELQSPKGNVASCDTVEILSVTDGKISSSRICFDTAAFAKFMAQG